MMKREIFKVEGDKVVRLRRNCPKCGDGVFLGEHKNRLSCGKCGYTEFKGKRDIKSEMPVEETKEEELVEKKEAVEHHAEEPVTKGESTEELVGEETAEKQE